MIRNTLLTLVRLALLPVIALATMLAIILVVVMRLRVEDDQPAITTRGRGYFPVFRHGRLYGWAMCLSKKRMAFFRLTSCHNSFDWPN